MPASRIEIVPATLRDVSYIVASMCPEDWAEIAAQMPAGASTEQVAALHLHGEAWAAMLDGQPVQAFGAVPATASVLNLWAFGTRARRRAIPAVTRFLRRQAGEWVARGVTRVEARAMAGHPTAHRWLRGLGGQSYRLPCWGSGGEEFTLYWWTRKTWAEAAAAA